jgi:hypothetical protein
MIAQHYGVPTQLLDWTNDPFIAIFFAVSQLDLLDKDASLFYIGSVGTMVAEWNIQLPFEGGLLSLKPPVLDERIRSQKSMFTIQSYGDHQEFTPLDKDPDLALFARLGRVIIPHERKISLLAGLAKIGIDHSVLIFAES